MGVTQTLSLIGQMAGATSANPAGTAAAGKAALGIGGTAATGLLGTALNAYSSFGEARALRDYGDTAYRESLLEADRVLEEGRQFQAAQKMKYVMSGVQVAGTPMQILQDTSLKVQDEINAVKRRGEAMRTLAYMKASYTSLRGAAGLLSDSFSTSSSVGKLYNNAKSKGLFDSYQSDNLTGTLIDTNAVEDFRRFV